jgi:hypothetical protein
MRGAGRRRSVVETSVACLLATSMHAFARIAPPLLSSDATEPPAGFLAGAQGSGMPTSNSCNELM